MEALSMIKIETDKHIYKILGSHSLNEIQKIALCGTAHFLWRVQSMGLEK